MIRQIPWAKTLLDDFISEALLSEREIKLMHLRIKGASLIKQAQELFVSTATISRMTVRLKEKYDNLHAANPERFPERHKLSYEANLTPNRDIEVNDDDDIDKVVLMF